jgi:hypothetical protein
MEIRVSREQLQQHSIFLGLPCYGGMAAANFTKALMDLSAACTQNGIQLSAYFLSNESLITRARSYISEVFLNHSQATHLMFIDSDIGFNPKDVLTLLALAISEPEKYDIIGAAYPKKTIAWEKIRAAVEKGKAEEDPNALENYAADFVFNPKPGIERIPLNEPAEVLEIGTGFMLVSRSAFKKFDDGTEAAAKGVEDKLLAANLDAGFAKTVSNRWRYDFTPDHVRSKHFDGSKKIKLYFQAEICPDTNRYLSEDYFFCQQVAKGGGRVWMCPWMYLEHMGSYFYKGSLYQMSQIGVSPTADPSKLGGKK